MSNGQTVSAERLCYIFTMRATTWLSQKRRRKRLLWGSMTYDRKRKGKQPYNNLRAKAILCTCFFQYLQMKLGETIVT
jgi:uncharacterized protein YdeI (YjbR/CyaY-like superfamily)